MIRGTVTKREAVVSLTVRGPGGKEETFEAVIDTGFDGWLSLPPATIERLELMWSQRGRAQLADGSISIFEIFEGSLWWNSELLRIPVHEADAAPLLGMGLLEGFELKIEAREGGKVTVKRLGKSNRNRPRQR